MVPQPQYAAYKPGAPAVHVCELPAPPSPSFLSDSNRHTADFNRALSARDVSKKSYCGMPKRVFIGVIALLIVLLIAIVAGAARSCCVDREISERAKGRVSLFWFNRRQS